MPFSRIAAKAHSVGVPREVKRLQPSANHFRQAALSVGAQKKLARAGFSRVAGNIFVQKSTQDFWKVEGGKVKRLTKSVTQVDNGEKAAGSPRSNPSSFLNDVLDDLSF
jgi:hypothetical protein